MRRPEGEADFEILGKILCQCFNAPDEFWPKYRERLGDGAFRVIERDGRIAGGLGILALGRVHPGIAALPVEGQLLVLFRLNPTWPLLLIAFFLFRFFPNPSYNIGKNQIDQGSRYFSILHI